MRSQQNASFTLTAIGEVNVDTITLLLAGTIPTAYMRTYVHLFTFFAL